MDKFLIFALVLNQLAELFSNLEYCREAAVTPTRELAKLALVTSRDEEDDEIGKGGTDSSNDTDATLVDDGLSRPSLTSQEVTLSPPLSPTSVLGKRARDEKKGSDMEIDSPTCENHKDKEVFAFLNAPPRAFPKSSDVPSELSSSKRFNELQDIDTNSSQKPPPLPPRKKPEVSSSEMMFGEHGPVVLLTTLELSLIGRQHDVAECMDNCMFQIETALLKFNGDGDKSTEQVSIVKR